MKTGLILEGGAMRGMFTCGVIDVFMENGIVFDGAVGVSAGACFGCNYKSGQIGRGIRYNKKYCGRREYASWYNLFTEGNLFGVKFCYETLPLELDVFDTEAFQENPMEFYAVCTDACTGEAVYHKCTTGLDEDIQYFRASASMPFVSKVVEIGDKRLMDGGVADSIPIRFFQELGYDRNVVVLTRPREYRKKRSRATKLLGKLMLKEYPNLAKAMEKRPDVYNMTLEYIIDEERRGNVYVISPEEDLNMPHMCKEPDELERVYQIGRSVAVKHLSEVARYVGKSENK